MRSCKTCRHTLGEEHCRGCNYSTGLHKWEPKPMTNADRIRAMSDEELAVWLAKFTDCGECPVWDGFPHCTTSEESCACRWHEWLKEEVSE